MRRLSTILILLLWLAGLGRLVAAEFSLTDGTALRGEPVSFTDQGLVVKLEDGSFSPRHAWVKFSQEALKELAKNPKAKAFTGLYIEVSVEEKQKTKKAEIVLKPVPRLERPAPGISLAAALATPGGLSILCVIFLANLFAAYEIAHYRNRPLALVCGAAVIAPVLGPVLFLSLPTWAAEEPPPPPAEPPVPVPVPAAPSSVVGIPDDAQHAPSGLSLAARKTEATGHPELNQIYQRGQYTINRRFIETKFAGFFRVVPGEAEKDLVLVIKAVRGEYAGTRISRITTDDLHLQLQRGGASAEVMIPFAEILEVQLRHKDAQ